MNRFCNFFLLTFCLICAGLISCKDGPKKTEVVQEVKIIEPFRIRKEAIGDSAGENRNEFPILEGDSAICKKVNNQLINDVFFIDTIPDNFNGILKTLKVGEQWMGVSQLSYKVNLLNQKFYSVTISGEGCGAYCESFDRSLNFNLETGELVKTDQLFTSEGKQKVLSFISGEKMKQVSEQISDAEVALAKPDLSADERELAEGIWGVFTACMESADYKDLDYVEFEVFPDRILLRSGRCSNHVSRAYDEIGNFIFDLPVAKWDNFTSAYIKQVRKAK